MSGSTKTTSSQTGPWAPATGALNNMIGQVQQEEPTMADWTPYGSYTGPAVAGFTEPQTAGFNMTSADATNGTSQVGTANSALAPFLNGTYLSTQNPGYQAAADSLAQSVLPQLDSQWESAGRFSGNEEAPQAISKGLSAALAPYAFQNYTTGLTNDLSAAGLSPSLDQAQYIDPNAMLGIGQTQQQLNQQQIASAIYSGTYGQQQPEQALQTTLSQLLALGGAGSQGYSTTTSNPSLLSQIMGGGQMGLGALSSLGFLAMA